MKKILSILLVAATLTASAQVTTNPGGGSTGGGGGSYTSSNGVTLSGSNFKLGGLLTENTSIGGGTFTLSLNNKTYNNTSQRINIYTDTISFTLNGSRFLHTTSNGGGGWNYGNMWMGFGAGQTFGASSTGYANTGFGRYVMRYLDGTSSTAASNAAFGNGSMENMTVGTLNTASGVASMGSVLNGTGIVAVGHHAGLKATGSDNSVFIGRSSGDSCRAIETVAVGHYTLAKNSGLYNTSVGTYSGYESTTGTKNTHLGWSAGKNNTTPTENTLIGYLAGGTGVGTSGYNTYVGSRAGAATTGGNTNVAVGREALVALTTGIGNVAIGNNAAQTGNWSNSIIIGKTINVTGNYELNLGGALYGANIYSTTPRFAFGKVAGTNSTLDMGGCALPIILPKSASTPTVGLETGMMYYNPNTESIDFYSGTATFMPICKLTPMSVVTSASGIAANSSVFKTVLNATSNAITQTISPASAGYKNVELVFLVINSSVNATTFSIPSSSYVNGVTGATSFVASNGAIVTCSCDGTTWYITNK